MNCVECCNELTDDELYYLEDICCECEGNIGHDEFVKMMGKLGLFVLILLILALTFGGE